MQWALPSGIRQHVYGRGASNSATTAYNEDLPHISVLNLSSSRKIIVHEAEGLTCGTLPIDVGSVPDARHLPTWRARKHTGSLLDLSASLGCIALQAIGREWVRHRRTGAQQVSTASCFRYRSDLQRTV